MMDSALENKRLPLWMESSTLLLQGANDNRPMTLVEEMKAISVASARLRTRTARLVDKALVVGLDFGAFRPRRGR